MAGLGLLTAACLAGGAAPASADVDPFALRDTATAVDCRAVAIGDTSVCTAYVEDVALEGVPTVPTGLVTFDDGGAGGTFGATSCELGDAGGLAMCQVTYKPAVAGTPVIGAVYGGDATHAPSAASLPVAVRKRTTSVSVGCPGSITLGTAAQCAATVTDVDLGTRTRPGGTVTFSGSGGTFSPSQCTLPDLGVQVCAVDYKPTSIADGEVTARYNGDATHAARSAVTGVSVTQRSVATALECAAATIGHATTCTASVTDDAAWPATGAVRFSGGSGAFSAPSCLLSAAGACSVTYTPAAGGSDQLRADYDGDANHLADVAQTVLAVAKRPTVTSLSCADPITVGASTSCTASVTDEDGGTATQPTGTVTFGGPGGFAPSCELPVGGTSCSVDYTPSTAGDQALTAAYSGDATTHLPSNARTTITAARRSTATTLVCAPDSVELGSAATCTATVTDTDAGVASAPAGTVTFGGDGDFSVPTCELSAAGDCSVEYTPASPGTHTVSATYGGEPETHTGSSGTDGVTATRSEPRATATTLSCTPPSTMVGVFVTCTAGVADTDTGTPSAPEGTVNFSGGSGAYTPASCELTAGACTVSYLPSAFGTGSHALTATYAGSTAHRTSSGNTAVGVAKRPAHAAVACAPTRGEKGFTCTVTVTDTGPGTKSVPGGTVKLTTSNGATAKAPQSCTLAAGSCSVSYPNSLSGAKRMTVEYAGGPAHLADAQTVDDPTA